MSTTITMGKSPRRALLHRLFPLHAFALSLITGLISGCASEQEYSNPLESPAYLAALEKQNQALRYVKVYKHVPDGALGIRPVMAASCSADPQMTGADEAYILKGLKLKAYKLGGDGIAEVSIEELPKTANTCPGGVPVGGTARTFTVQY